MSNLWRVNPEYWRYDTNDLNDERIPKFIDAMQRQAVVSFQGEKFLIQHIHLTPARAEVVLREVGE